MYGSLNHHFHCHVLPVVTRVWRWQLFPGGPGIQLCPPFPLTEAGMLEASRTVFGGTGGKERKVNEKELDEPEIERAGPRSESFVRGEAGFEESSNP